jgi:EAL and modified HD-GYP domain-containing signal transduction protein
VAEDIDTDAQFKQCQALGCSLFGGRFFLEESPGIREVSPSQRAITQLIGLVAADASTAEIEAKIKTDPVLTLNLINLVNTPALSVHRVESLHQVLMILGRRQLQRWLQLLLFSKSAQQEDTHPSLALLLLAAGRARLMELVAQTLHAGSRNIADAAFTVGIMSLMDRLFGISMSDLLDEMSVVEEVRAALQNRDGPYGELLWLAELCEWQMDGDATLHQLQSLLQKLHLSHHTLYGLQLDSFEWSDQVGRSIG